MTSEKILQSSLIDIVFEERNKAYGAYPLRKFYNNRLVKALAAMVALVSVFCFIISMKHVQEVLITKWVDDPGTVIIKHADPLPEPPKPQQQARQASAKPHNSQAFISHVVITNDPVPPIETLAENIPIDVKTVSGKPDIHVGVPLNISGDLPAVAAIPAIDHNTPVGVAEVMPSFPGGMEALRNFLIKNLKNPQDLQEGESVSVKIKFIVGYDGMLKGFQIAEDGGSEFNNEVIRVLKKMPAWIPGKTKGENVSVYYTIPVKFISTE